MPPSVLSQLARYGSWNQLYYRTLIWGQYGRSGPAGEAVREDGRDVLGRERLATGGIQVKTTQTLYLPVAQ